MFSSTAGIDNEIEDSHSSVYSTAVYFRSLADDGKPFCLKVKSTQGVSKVDKLTPDSSFRDLKLAICDLLNISPASVKILHGFPPRRINVPDDSSTLNDLQIRHGDCLQVEEVSAALADGVGEGQPLIPADEVA